MADQYHLKKKQRMQIYYRRVAAGMTGGVAALGSMGFLAMGLPGMGVGLGVALGIIAVTLAVAGLMKGIQAYKRNHSGKLPPPKEVKEMFNKELEVQIDTAKEAIRLEVEESDKIPVDQKEALIEEVSSKMEDNARSGGKKVCSKYDAGEAVFDEPDQTKPVSFSESAEVIRNVANPASTASRAILEELENTEGLSEQDRATLKSNATSTFKDTGVRNAAREARDQVQEKHFAKEGTPQGPQNQVESENSRKPN